MKTLPVLVIDMDNQAKLFTGVLARLVSGLEKTSSGHQAYEPDTSERISAVRITRDLHYHESWELKIPLRGRLHCRFENRNFDICQNSALLIAPKSIHYSTMPADIRHCALWLNFLFENGDVHLTLTQGCRSAHYVLSSDQKSELTTLLGQSANEFCGHIALVIVRARKQIGQNMATKWLSLLCSSFISAILSPSVSSSRHELVSRTIALLNNTFHDATITINRMARMLDISPKYLSCVFHRQTGVTPRQKLILIRLERAFRQLQTGRFTVKEVAAFTGWQNQFYFSNSFHRHYGVSPSQVPGSMNKVINPHISRADYRL